jgi:type IV secretion system protein VirD4
MDTIIGNMDTTLFLGGKEKTTLEEISKMLGKETIDMYNTSVTKGTQESHGQNFQKLGKDLLSVDEIAVMDGEKCILQVRGERPFLSRKYNIEKHPNYRYLADYDPKHTFDIGQYLSSRLKLRKDESYVVAEIDMTAEATE